MSKNALRGSKKSLHGRYAGLAVQQSVENVVNYLAETEWNDFNGEPDHIWHSVRILRDWIGSDKFDEEDAVMAELQQRSAKADAA
jgi:hypothetical protein